MTAVEYIGVGLVIVAVIAVLFSMTPSLADRLRQPVDAQVCDVLANSSCPPADRTR